MRAIYLFSTSKHPNARNINSLEITFLQPSINFTDYDYLILTSKQAIKALKFYDIKEYIHKKALCISNATAQSYTQLGADVLDIAKGYGDTLTSFIQKYPKETKWLYLRAETIASDFASLSRKNGYKIDEKIVYKSECSTDIHKSAPKNNAILIFTSPSSVECFLHTHTLNKSYSIIVIGKTTAKKLPPNTDFSISQEKTIENCMQMALLL